MNLSAPQKFVLTYHAFLNLPYPLESDITQISCYRWCAERFGNPAQTDKRWMMKIEWHGISVRFTDIADYTFFILAWSKYIESGILNSNILHN